MILIRNQLFKNLKGYKFYTIGLFDSQHLIKAKNIVEACNYYNEDVSDLYAPYRSIDDFYEVGKVSALGRIVEYYYDNPTWNKGKTLDECFSDIFNSEAVLIF